MQKLPARMKHKKFNKPIRLKRPINHRRNRIKIELDTDINRIGDNGFTLNIQASNNNSEKNINSYQLIKSKTGIINSLKKCIIEKIFFNAIPSVKVTFLLFVHKVIWFFKVYIWGMNSN